MPVPSTMSDLNTTAASNYPAGGDAIGNSLDDTLRAHAAIVRRTNGISGSSIASAATTDISASESENVTVTGTTTITSLGTGFAGCKREVLFSGALQLTHSANLIMPNAANFTTIANDVLTFRCLAASQWICTAVSRAAVSFASINLTGVSTYNSLEIGFRGIPRNVTNSGHTFITDDNGKARVKTDTGSYTYTVNTGVFLGDHVVTVVNMGSSGTITLAQGAGMTIQLSGTTTTGNRTVNPGGVVTLYFQSPTLVIAGGTGLT